LNYQFPEGKGQISFLDFRHWLAYLLLPELNESTPLSPIATYAWQ
jgi:hypothetical protein